MRGHAAGLAGAERVGFTREGRLGRSRCAARERIRETVELARRFSLHVEGVPLLYNLIVAERRREVRYGRGGVDRGVPDGARRVPTRTVRSSPMRSIGAADAFRIRNASSSRAGRGGSANWFPTRSPATPGCGHWSPNASGASRARGHGCGRNRLLDWTPPRAGAGRWGSRMDFRWFRVRQLLIDLHRGFAA